MLSQNKKAYIECNAIINLYLTLKSYNYYSQKQRYVTIAMLSAHTKLPLNMTVVFVCRIGYV